MYTIEGRITGALSKIVHLLHYFAVADKLPGDPFAQVADKLIIKSPGQIAQDFHRQVGISIAPHQVTRSPKFTSSISVASTMN